MIVQATRLSQSLGVGKLPHTLSVGLQGLIQDGMKYAFRENSEGDDYVLGVRLPFLSILCR